MAITKALISCTVTVQLICVFVFAYAKNMFSQDAAHFSLSAGISGQQVPGVHGYPTENK